MHDIKKIVENVDYYKEQMKKRFVDENIIDELAKLNDSRKRHITKLEGLRSELKSTSKSIGELKKKGEDTTKIQESVTLKKKDIEKLEKELDSTLLKQNDILISLPNITSDDTPYGEDESCNIEIFQKGKLTEFDFDPKDHAELGEKLGFLDFESAAKLTGSRFCVYKDGFAQLERALINFMIDEHIQHGHIEVIPPFIVNENTLFGTGQLPKFKGDLFKIEDKNWYLIPTAEVPLTNLKKDSVFNANELPLKFCAYTPCFRSEAGSYGKDTRGLIRQHQFNKVELVNIVHPDDAESAHQDMVERAKSILDLLELPYRGIVLCSGDIGFSAVKTIDLEVWLPGQNKYREISSISNCGEFQAKRASIRFKKGDSRPEFAHTLNGSGLAVGRTLVAIVENYQQKDGSIKVPRVLQQYMRGKKTIQ